MRKRPTMRSDPEKLIADTPGQESWIGNKYTLIDETSASSVMLRILVRGVNQNIGIYDQGGFSSSNNRYNSSRFAMSTRAVPIGQDGNSKVFSRTSFGSSREAIMCLIPASTIEVIVVLRFAASSRSCCINASSKLNVVFIWKTISPIWLYGSGTLPHT